MNAQGCDGVRGGSFAAEAVPALIANISCLMSAMSSTAAPQMPRFAVKSTAGNDPACVKTLDRPFEVISRRREY